MLSLLEHVARRTVERSYRAREAAAATWDGLCMDLDRGIGPPFVGGRRLRDGEVDRLADGARAAFERLDPLAVIDHAKSASAGRPRSGEREILCVGSCAGGAGDRRFVELTASRVSIARKRAAVEASPTLIRLRTHALERAIERGLVGRPEDVEREAMLVLLDHAGLVVLGRALIGRGVLAWPDTFPIPFGDGLVLGAFETEGETGRECLIYDVLGRRHAPLPAPLLTTIPTGTGGRPCAYTGRTILAARDLGITQCALHEALAAFVRRHRGLVNALGEAMLWPDAGCRPVASDLVGGAAWREALDALAAIVSDPGLRLREGGRPGLLVAGAARPLLPVAAQGVGASAAREASSSTPSASARAARAALPINA